MDGFASPRATPACSAGRRASWPRRLWNDWLDRGAETFVARTEAGDANNTLDTLAAIATALGAEPSLRLYPTTGPRLRDHLQVRLIETLLAALHPRWQTRLEVPVYRPVR